MRLDADEARMLIGSESLPSIGLMTGDGLVHKITAIQEAGCVPSAGIAKIGDAPLAVFGSGEREVSLRKVSFFPENIARCFGGEADRG